MIRAVSTLTGPSVPNLRNRTWPLEELVCAGAGTACGQGQGEPSGRETEAEETQMRRKEKSNHRGIRCLKTAILETWTLTG